MTTAWTPDVATGDPARAVRLTLFWGLDAVSLRMVGGGRVPDVTEGPLRRRLDESDLPVAALDPGLFEGDAAAKAVWLNEVSRLDEVAAFGDRFGCRLVRVGALASGGAFDRAASAPALRQAGTEAARLGLVLAVRNEAGTAVATGADLAGLLAAVAHPAVGADWRPADAVLAGEAPADGLAALVAAGIAVRCVGVRDGDAVDGAWHDAVVGEGALGWDAHLDALAQAGVDGPLVLDALPEPVRTSGLSSATALIRSARRARRASAGG